MSTPNILVTGATGFVGKVVVEELCRQTYAGLLPPLRITLLIRASKGKTAQQRWDRLLDSLCFVNLHRGWENSITVVEADIEKTDLGLDGTAYTELSFNTTHIIHCAASTEFDLPFKDAVRSNIDSTLHMLALARQCPNLSRMVHTSTAYVHAQSTDRIEERLAPLPGHWQPDALYQAISDNRITEAELLKISGHANTYTFTKCLAEHLLVQGCAGIPLSIVRPSIVSVALQHPFPGFIDSYGALGGFGALFGAGFLHVMEGDRSTLFDVVPVDLVAQHLIDKAEIAMPLDTPESTPIREKKAWSEMITHCVAGMERSGPFEMINSIGLEYFAQHQEQRRVHWRYTGPRNMAYHWHKTTSQSIPIALGCAWFKVTGQKKQYKLARLLQRSVEKCNKVFPYFLTHTFDFVNSQEFPEGFDKEEYFWLTARSVHRHLIKRELWQEKKIVAGDGEKAL